MSLTGAAMLGMMALWSSTGVCMAEEVTNLVVEYKSGETEAFVLADKPVLTFDMTDCTITTSDYVVTHSMSDITRAYFAELKSTQGLDEAAERVSIDFSRPGQVVVSGIEPATTVSIYDLEGRMVAGATATNDGEAVVDIEHLMKGAVYVVAISNLKNFKFYKR